MTIFGVIILHYNTFEDTQKCLDSFFEISTKNVIIKIVVVDNGSTNFSYEKLKKIQKENDSNIFEIIRCEKNLGFSGGNNFGFDYLIKRYKLDFVVCSNNDIVIKDKDFFAKIARNFKDNQFFVLGPDIYSTFENIHQNPMKTKEWNINKINKTIFKLRVKKVIAKIMKYTYFYSIIRKYKHSQCDSIYTESRKDVQLNGSLLVFSKLFFLETGFCFYPGTFLYLEEDILYNICQHKNYLMVYDKNILVYHNHSSSTRKMMGSDLVLVTFHIKNEILSLKVFRELLKKRKKND